MDLHLHVWTATTLTLFAVLSISGNKEMGVISSFLGCLLLGGMTTGTFWLLGKLFGGV